MKNSTTTLPPQQPVTLLPARELQRFVVSEEDLEVAKDVRSRGHWDCMRDCLIATTLKRQGYAVKDCCFSYVEVDGAGRWMTNARQLVDDFIFRRYESVRECLPFVVELE